MASAYTTAPLSSHDGMANQHQSPPPKTNFSQSVKDYVARAFAEENDIEGVSREDVTFKLKEIIGGITKQGALDVTPWETMPLPQQFIQQERAAAAHAAYAAAWHSYNYQMQANQPDPLSSKKRRHDDSQESADIVTPPWKKSQNNNRPGLESRITKSKKSKATPNLFEPSSKFQEELEQRRRRFEQDKYSYSPPQSNSDRSHDEVVPTGPIIGTCQKLEKDYFRLTRPPIPSEVRPLPVLKEAFKMLRRKWREGTNWTPEQKKAYMTSQFKALRQDLTVQRIKNSFTVEVYELHARISLEHGDMGEYNQCQTQLRALYSMDLGGNPGEFLAYRVLYFVHTTNRTDMNRLLSELTAKDLEQPAVAHALKVRKAVSSGNYHNLFKLYLEAPNMGAYLMDMFVPRERLSALVKVCSTYHVPGCDLPLRFITEELGFESDNDAISFVQRYIPDYNKFISEPAGELLFRSSNREVRDVLTQARTEAFNKIDIKGQI